MAPMSVSNSTKQAKARDLKHRVLTCLHKLSDRDTHSTAASELESIAKNLTADALSSFLSSISATNSSDKSPVRRQCIRLISVLSEHHGNSLSPHLSKLLSAVVRRLRDPDSSVRSACVAASLSLSSHITSPPFASIAKPFLESLFTEQDTNTQNGAASCLAAIIEGSRSPDVTNLRKLLPKLAKLAKSDNFKAKPALLILIGSIVEVNGVLNSCVKNVINDLITCLIEFLSSEDWAARKAAAEALMKIAAAAEGDCLSEYKASCLKTFESKRFDKVKAARESMKLMIEAWKEIPDPSDEASPSPSPSRESSKEAQKTCKEKRYSSPDNKAITNISRNSLNNANGNRRGPAMFKKFDICVGEEADFAADGRSEINDTHYDKVIKADSAMKQREQEELSMIRKHLVQIENQQSNLMDLLQRLIGNSEDGIQSLEARVHGLELALDGISFDLAVSRRAPGVCCTGFLRSKRPDSPLENNRGRFYGRMNPVAEIQGCPVGIS